MKVTELKAQTSPVIPIVPVDHKLRDTRVVAEKKGKHPVRDMDESVWNENQTLSFEEELTAQEEKLDEIEESRADYEEEYDTLEDEFEER